MKTKPFIIIIGIIVIVFIIAWLDTPDEKTVYESPEMCNRVDDTLTEFDSVVNIFEDYMNVKIDPEFSDTALQRKYELGWELAAINTKCSQWNDRKAYKIINKGYRQLLLNKEDYTLLFIMLEYMKKAGGLNVDASRVFEKKTNEYKTTLDSFWIWPTKVKVYENLLYYTDSAGNLRKRTIVKKQDYEYEGK